MIPNPVEHRGEDCLGEGGVRSVSPELARPTTQPVAPTSWFIAHALSRRFAPSMRVRAGERSRRGHWPGALPIPESREGDADRGERMRPIGGEEGSAPSPDPHAQAAVVLPTNADHERGRNRGARAHPGRRPRRFGGGVDQRPRSRALSASEDDRVVSRAHWSFSLPPRRERHEPAPGSSVRRATLPTIGRRPSRTRHVAALRGTRARRDRCP